MGILWENSLQVFLILTCLIAGGAAWMAARGLALTWQPYRRVIYSAALLGAAVRFFNYALFESTLLSLQFYLVDTLILVLIASLGYRVTRTNQMVTRYRWLYRRTSPITWSQS